MLLASSARAPSSSVVLDPNIRSRPVISGGTLRTDTGEIIRSGASISISGTNGAQAVQAATWQDGRALGLNCMRLGVKTGTTSIAATLSVVDQAVELARTRRMYVMLGYFDNAPGSWDDDVPANRTKYINFWIAAATRYANLDHVFYEMVNEPTSGAGAWGDVAQFTSSVKNGLRDVFDVMRSGAPDTVILWPSPANLSPSSEKVKALITDMDGRGNGVPVDYSKAVWSFHYYGGKTSLGTRYFAVSGNSANATDGGRAGLLNLKAFVPIIMTETNWWMDATPREWLIDALDLMEDIGIGWVLLRRPGQTSPAGSTLLAPLYLDNKIAQLRSRGYNIPVE